jgi:hypothetical protein
MEVHQTEVTLMKTGSSSTLEKTEKNQKVHTIKVAILAEQLFGWGSGKHYFPIILHDYTWKVDNTTYNIHAQYIYDKDILRGQLRTNQFDVLLVPGGGVGDGLAIIKGSQFSRNARKWKKNISAFIREGGGYVGICGGTALITDLKTAEKKPQTFVERQYHKSALGVTCVSSYYKSLAFPLFFPFQKKHPEKIGAVAYAFSFAPGETVDGVRIHTGGVPVDFQICQNHPIASGLNKNTERIRWWAGPALVVPEHPDREVKILARYPTQDISNDTTIRIHAWKYVGGLHGIIRGFLKAASYIKKEKDTLKNLFLYTFYMAGTWKKSDKYIELDFADKPCITTEIYPNEKKGRILLCAAHPEYMVWWNGRISEMKSDTFNCLGTGLYHWEGISPVSKHAQAELTHTWWMVRRFVAWAAKVPDDHLPPIHTKEQIYEQHPLLKNIFWDGSLLNQMENI